MGNDFRRQRIELRIERVVEGVIDALENREPALTSAEMRQALAEVQRRVRDRSQGSID